MKHLGLGLCLVVLASLCAVPAGATLIGDEVMGQVDASGFGTIFGPSNAVVGGGVEFSFPTGVGPIFMDLDASSITVGLTNIAGGSVPIGGNLTFIVTGLDWVDFPLGKVIGLQLTSNTFGTAPTTWSTGDHSLSINVLDQSIEGTESATFTILTDHGDIPEPTTMALLATGAAGLIAKRRRVV